MRNISHFSCGLGPALEVIGGKWKVMLHPLNDRTPQTGELRRQLPGISDLMLTQQLRELEPDGVVARQIFGEVPPRVHYGATEHGRGLNRALGPIADWGAEHFRRQQKQAA